MPRAKPQRYIRFSNPDLIELVEVDTGDCLDAIVIPDWDTDGFSTLDLLEKWTLTEEEQQDAALKMQRWFEARNSPEPVTTNWINTGRIEYAVCHPA